MSPWKLLNSSPAVCLLYAERMALTTAVYAKLQLNIEVIKNVKKKKNEIKKSLIQHLPLKSFRELNKLLFLTLFDRVLCFEISVWRMA